MGIELSSFAIGHMCGGVAAVTVSYGRKLLRFIDGKAHLEQVTFTEKSLPGEDETQFVDRLSKRFRDMNGTFQIVFKNGKPDYAIITLDQLPSERE
jgi:hypothetical protein